MGKELRRLKEEEAILIFSWIIGKLNRSTDIWANSAFF